MATLIFYTLSVSGLLGIGYLALVGKWYVAISAILGLGLILWIYTIAIGALKGEDDWMPWAGPED